MRTYAPAKLLCLLLITLAIPSAAKAQDINAIGAAHLKTIFQSILDKQAAAYAQTDGPHVTYDGEISVEQASDYYAITLPPTIINMPHEQDDAPEGTPASTIKIGMITINAIPHDKTKQWKMTFTTPTPIFGYNAEGAQNLRINIGKQSAAGIWHEDFENFIKLDASYENITADATDMPTIMSIGKLGIVYDLSEDENARWSGPSQMIATDLKITPANNKGHVSLGKMRMSTNIDQANLLSIKNYAALMTQTQEDGANMDMGAIIDTIINYANGFTTNIEIADLKMRKGSEDEITNILDLSLPQTSKQFTDIDLGGAHLSMTSGGLLEDKASASLSFGYKGFAATPMDANKQTLMPSNFTMSLNNKNIPLKQITTMVKNAISSEAGVSNSLSTALLVTKLPALLAIAGTTLEIENSISNSAYAVNTNGSAKAELTSIFGGTAQLTSTIKNLDKMIEATQGLMQNADSENLSENKKLLTALSTLKKVGTLSQDSAGNTIHTFNLIMNESGNITLNGQPAMPILFSLQGLF